MFTTEEHELLVTAAEQTRTAKVAFAAEAVVAAARTGPQASGGVLREALVELMQAAGLVRRVGVNLNQAVRALHAIGERPGDLEPAAAYCARVVQRIDAAAEDVRRRLP